MRKVTKCRACKRVKRVSRKRVNQKSVERELMKRVSSRKRVNQKSQSKESPSKESKSKEGGVLSAASFKLRKKYSQNRSTINQEIDD